MTNPETKTVLIIDDEPVIRESLRDYLVDHGYHTITAEDGLVGVELFKQRHPDAVLTDLRMPNMEGLEVLRQIGELSPETPLIVASGTGRITDSIQALRLGAWDYILKPIEDLSIVSLSIEKALERARLRRENRRYQEHLEELVRERTQKLVIELAERERAEKANEHLQAQLLQSKKMESIGRLAGGVAHDFNNMLQTILGNAEFALDGLNPSDPRHEELMEIQKAGQRCAKLASQLLAFARKQPFMPQVLDLNKTMEGMLAMLRRLVGEDITLTWVPGAHLPSIMMAPSQIDQILANLCVNARDAISDVGRIAIETHAIPADAPGPPNGDTLPDGPHVLLKFSDTGCGMDAETLKHVFEPFFTTKEVGKGTGLGLATIYGIVKQNNGTLCVESEPGKGTTFHIYLPACPAKEDESGQFPTDAQEPGGQETVLIVEDEKAIMAVTRQMLARKGYQVLTASSPEEALRIALQPDRPIDLLITDVVMPGMNGCDLARKIQDAHQDIRILFMSGFSSNIIDGRGLLPAKVHFLNKPFTSEDLAAQVRAALNDTGSLPEKNHAC